MSLKSLPGIKNKDDIKKLVNNFYVKVVADDLLGPVFEDVAHTDWTLHLPKMYDFWETVILGGTYTKGNPVTRHLEIDKQNNLERKHFDQWLLLFFETVDEYFTGPKAKEIKERAVRISQVIQKRIKSVR